MNVLIPPNNTTWYYRIAIVARSDSGATNPGSSDGWNHWDDQEYGRDYFCGRRGKDRFRGN